MKLFLEYSAGAMAEQALSGCQCRASRRGNRVRGALVSCPGGDMAAQVIAQAGCSMAWGLLSRGASLQSTGQILLETMGQRGFGFVLLEMDGRGHLRAVEYQMPPVALLHQGESRIPWGGEAELAGKGVILREDALADGDLCCSLSQGILQCGAPGGQEAGWQRQGATDYLARAYTGKESARQIKELLFSACQGMGGSGAQGAAFFCRAKAMAPLLVAVGLPRKGNEGQWALKIANFRGTRVLVGPGPKRLLEQSSGPWQEKTAGWLFLTQEEVLAQVLPLLDHATAAASLGTQRDARQLADLLDRQSTSLHLLVGSTRRGGLQRNAILAEQIADRLRQGDKRVEVEYC